MNHAKGFTLLELMVVLAILGALLGVVTPNLSFDSQQQQLQQEARSLRYALQTKIDQAWLEGQTTLVTRNSGAVKWLRHSKQAWQSEGAAYEVSTDIDQFLNVDQRRLRAAEKTLDVAEPVDLIFLPSGEYLPFRWVLRSRAGDQAVIVGDGVNALSLE